MLTKIRKANYLVKLMLLLATIFILVSAIFFLAGSFPQALGNLPPQYQIKKSYEFEPWSFTFHELSVFFPEGGIIVPVYENEKQKAVLLIGRGVYNNHSEIIETEKGDLQENPAGIFLMLTEEQLEKLKRDIIFVPVEDPAVGIKTAHIFKRQLCLPVIWPDKIPFVFPPPESASYYYFIDKTGEPLLPPVNKQTGNPVYIPGLLYILFYIIIGLVILILSLDYPPMHSMKARQNIVSNHWELFAFLAVGIMALGGETLPRITGRSEFLPPMAYGAAVLLLIILWKAGKIDRPDINPNNTYSEGYFMAIVAALILLAAILRLPQGIELQGWQTTVMLFKVFFLWGLPREIIWRGYIQTTCGKRWGPAGGLVGTAFLAGTMRTAVIFITAPWMLSYPFTYLEFAVLEPGLAIILGFLYLRTKNILSCALLHTLVIFLPQILVL